MGPHGWERSWRGACVAVLVASMAGACRGGGGGADAATDAAVPDAGPDGGPGPTTDTAVAPPGWIELGSHPTTPAAGTGDLPFTVPAGAVSFVIVAEAIGRGVCLYPRRLVDPGGVVWHDLGAPGGPRLRLWPGFPVLTILVPEGDGPTPPAAEWTISFDTFACAGPNTPYDDRPTWSGIVGGTATPVASTIDRVAILPKLALGGTLHLNFHIAPALGITAAEAPAHPWILAFLARIQEVYDSGGAGVTIGPVQFFDAPSGYDTIDSWAEQRAACVELAVHAADGGPAVNVVLTGGYTGEVGFATGVALAYPGATFHEHTEQSCVSAEDRPTDAVSMGSLLAHEIGHHLGLWHTSEGGGPLCLFAPEMTCYDPVADTAECPDPGGPTSGTCGDAANMLWPAASTVTNCCGTLTPGQGLVLARNPTIR